MSYRPGGCLTTQLRRPQRASREGVAAAGSMRDFDSFAHSTEKDRVVADNVTGANRLNADFLFLPFSDQAFAGIDTDLIQIAVHGSGQDFGNLERGPARRIFLEPMMSFNDFDVVFISQGFRHFADDLVDQIHAHAHVGREHAGNLAGNRFQFSELGGIESRRPDHHRSSTLRHRA